MSAAWRGSLRGVGDRHRLAADGDQPGDAVAERHAELLHLVGLLPERDLEDQLLPVLRRSGRARRRARRSRRAAVSTIISSSRECETGEAISAGGRGQGQRLPQLLGEALVGEAALRRSISSCAKISSSSRVLFSSLTA